MVALSLKEIPPNSNGQEQQVLDFKTFNALIQ
jgi:hypothetical protein